MKKYYRRLLFSLGLVFLSQSVFANPIKLALNWKPEPQFGGFYAAQLKGFFKQKSLNVQIVPGGAGTPTIQVVAAGKAEFGIISAEELPLSRVNGSDVVALFAVYQTNPATIISRASRGFKSIQDVFNADGIIAVQKGLPFYMFLEKKYGAPKAQVVPTQGGISSFLSNPKFSQQALATSEPLLIEKEGIKVSHFNIADAGFNPYLTVLIARKSYIDKNPQVLKSMVESVRMGWKDYLDDPKETNHMMHELNPSMDEATFEESAVAQKPYIETPETKKHGIGYMSLERWKTLSEQMKSIGLLEKLPEASDLFRVIQ